MREHNNQLPAQSNENGRTEMDSQGNGGKVENFRDFAAIRSRRKSRNVFTMVPRLEQAEAIHRAAHQRSSRPPAREGGRMRSLAISLLWIVLAIMVGCWLRVVYTAFMFWGPV